MSLVIYYFSGTGNSRYVARELQRRLAGASLVPIVGLLADRAIPVTATAVGLVFPVQALGIPIALRRFLRKARFEDVSYVFAVATREGTVFRGFPQIDHLLRKGGAALSARFVLTMFSSDPRAAAYRCPDQREVAELTVGVQVRLDEIAGQVSRREVRRDAGGGEIIRMPYGPVRNRIMERLVLLAHASSEHLGGVNYYYSDETCTGCGICEKVCLSGKVRIDGRRPRWQKQVLCYMCFACVNFCPKESVQIRSIWAVKSFTPANGRYSHPYATAADIAAQKHRS